MKLIGQVLFTVFFFLNITSFAQNNIHSKIKPPYNIKDYFLLLPDSLIGNVNIEQRQLSLKYKTLEDLWNHNALWIIDTLDYRNGYMKLSSTGDGAGTYFEITYFIKKDKTREIAVNITKWDIAGAFSKLNFFIFENNKWKNITKDVVPSINISDLVNTKQAKIIEDNIDFAPIIYILPQKGKIILVKLDLETIETLSDDKVISKEDYINIKNSAKTIKLIWYNGVFGIKK